MNPRALVLIAVLAAACRRESAPPPAHSTTSTAVTVNTVAPAGQYEVGENGAQTVTIDGVRIEAAADLPDRSSNLTIDASASNPGGNLTVVVLRGWPISVVGGRVHVRDRDYGPAPSGSTVRLAKDGVHVGAELRGPLP
ncbi:MAG: hypothetical protein NTY35_06215 [Planctomycetota bacterium]|nr:hypothetical protein [Planctomycetota bacterium]